MINIARREIEKMQIYNGKPWQIDKGQKSMEHVLDDVDQARIFMRKMGRSDKPSIIIPRTISILTKLFPHKSEPKKQWTERRLWEWWCRRTSVVRHWQMMEMYQGAIHVEELEAMRREHHEFIQKTARLRALLEHQDKDFFGPQVEGLGSGLGNVVSAGIGANGKADKGE